MKRFVGFVAVAAVVSLGVVKLLAQDPLAAAPDMYKLDFENARVRVMDVTFQPGQKIAPHSHPEHVAYVLAGGKLHVTNADGTSMDADLKEGQVVWFPAVTHWAENTGTSVVHILVTELKEPAPATPAAEAPAGETAPMGENP